MGWRRHLAQGLGIGLGVALGVAPIALAQKALQTYFDHLERGQEALTLREYTQAVAAFTQAIKVQPQRFEAYYQRGQAYSFLGQDAAALADAEKAIQLNPTYAPAYTLRGLLRFRYRQDLEAALADLNQSLALDPQQAAVYGLRGSIKRQMQDLAGAIADFEQGIQVARARKQFSLYKALEQELERTRQMQP